MELLRYRRDDVGVAQYSSVKNKMMNLIMQEEIFGSKGLRRFGLKMEISTLNSFMPQPLVEPR